MGIIYGNGGFVKSRRNRLDPDALAFIARVELADGQPLEAGVKDAMNTLISGLKSDGILPLIKSCCLLAGAGTLNGALVQLIPNANPVTNIDFNPADYNRTLGLKGDGTSKRILTNRANNADPQNSNHNAVFVTESGGSQSFAFMGSGASATGNRNLLWSNGNLLFASRQNSSFPEITGQGVTTGFKGFSRTTATLTTCRTGGVNYTDNTFSGVPTADSISIFAFTAPSADFFNSGRLSFFSIGEALLTEGIGLALLDTRITTYMNTLASLNL